MVKRGPTLSFVAFVLWTAGLSSCATPPRAEPARPAVKVKKAAPPPVARTPEPAPKPRKLEPAPPPKPEHPGLIEGVDKLTKDLVKFLAVSETRGLAVIDFLNSDRQVTKLGQYTVTHLVTALFATRQVRLVERSKLRQVIDELKLVESDLFKKNVRVRLGQLLKVDALVIGEIYARRNRADIFARIVSTSTGEVISGSRVTVEDPVVSEYGPVIIGLGGTGPGRPTPIPGPGPRPTDSRPVLTRLATSERYNFQSAISAFTDQKLPLLNIATQVTGFFDVEATGKDHVFFFLGKETGNHAAILNDGRIVVFSPTPIRSLSIADLLRKQARDIMERVICRAFPTFPKQQIAAIIENAHYYTAKPGSYKRATFAKKGNISVAVQVPETRVLEARLSVEPTAEYGAVGARYSYRYLWNGKEWLHGMTGMYEGWREIKPGINALDPSRVRVNVDNVLTSQNVEQYHGYTLEFITSPTSKCLFLFDNQTKTQIEGTNSETLSELPRETWGKKP